MGYLDHGSNLPLLELAVEPDAMLGDRSKRWGNAPDARQRSLAETDDRAVMKPRPVASRISPLCPTPRAKLFCIGPGLTAAPPGHGGWRQLPMLTAQPPRARDRCWTSTLVLPPPDAAHRHVRAANPASPFGATSVCVEHPGSPAGRASMTGLRREAKATPPRPVWCNPLFDGPPIGLLWAPLSGGAS